MSNSVDPLNSRPAGPQWDHINRFIAVLQAAQRVDPTGWSWMFNPRCKHISVNIDMRGRVIHIQDIDGKPITIEEFEQQQLPVEKIDLKKAIML